MENGLLDRRESFDLLDNLDFGIMELGMSDEEPTENVTVEPVPIPEGNVSGGAQSTNTVPPPPLPTTASSATTVDVIASGEGAGVSVLRNSVNSEAVEVAPVSSVGGVEKVSTQGVGSDGVQGRVEAVGGANGGGGDGSGRDSGRSGQDGDQDINVRFFFSLLVRGTRKHSRRSFCEGRLLRLGQGYPRQAARGMLSDASCITCGFGPRGVVRERRRIFRSSRSQAFYVVARVNVCVPAMRVSCE